MQHSSGDARRQVTRAVTASPSSRRRPSRARPTGWSDPSPPAIDVRQSECVERASCSPVGVASTRGRPGTPRPSRSLSAPVRAATCLGSTGLAELWTTAAHLMIGCEGEGPGCGRRIRWWRARHLYGLGSVRGHLSRTLERGLRTGLSCVWTGTGRRGDAGRVRSVLDPSPEVRPGPGLAAQLPAGDDQRSGDRRRAFRDRPARSGGSNFQTRPRGVRRDRPGAAGTGAFGDHRQGDRRVAPGPADAIVSAFYGERTYREAARVLDTPEGTVKSRIRAGLRTLHLALGDLSNPLSAG